MALDTIQSLDLVTDIPPRQFHNEAYIWGNEGFNLGRTAATRWDNDAYKMRLLETTRLLGAVLKGKVPLHRLQEVMSTSDFPLIFGDVLDRQALGFYSEWPATWSAIARRGTVPDFRQVKRFIMDGGEGQLLPVPEGDEYKGDSLTEGRYNYTVSKYGRVMPFTWEAIVNDDLELLRTTPQRFGRSARRTENKFVHAFYVSSTGPNATFFSNTNKNIVNVANGATANNPPLSITGLQDAMIVLAKQLDANSEPIMIEAVTLMVPPSLEVTARNILNAIQIIVGADSAAQRILTENWMRGRVTLQVEPYLGMINTTNGGTAWYLFANPSAGRPALEIGFLRGYEAPQLFMKSPNQVRVGSSQLTDPMMGDFANDSLAYKVRHVFGGTLMDPKMAVASNGTGV